MTRVLLPTDLDPMHMPVSQTTVSTSGATPHEAPATSTRGATVTLDAKALAGLRDLDPQGKNGLLERVIKAFQDSLARLTPQLRSAMAAGEVKGIRHVAHTLKSSAASIGALRLANLCADLEAAVRAERLEGLQALVEGVCDEIDNIKPALDQLTVASPR